MNKNPLNNRLIKLFPIIGEIYPTYKGGAFDLDTPAIDFYRELFLPLLAEAIGKKDNDFIDKSLLMIEEDLRSSEDSRNTLAASLLVSLHEGYDADFDLLPTLPKTKKYITDWILNTD